MFLLTLNANSDKIWKPYPKSLLLFKSQQQYNMNVLYSKNNLNAENLTTIKI